MLSDAEMEEGRALAIHVWRQLDEETRADVRAFCERHAEVFGTDAEGVAETFELVDTLARVS